MTMTSSYHYEVVFGQEGGPLGLTVDNALTVIEVRSGGTAEQLGVHVGDALKQVNGQDIHEMTREQAVERIRQAGRPVRLQFSRGEGEKDDGEDTEAMQTQTVTHTEKEIQNHKRTPPPPPQPQAQPQPPPQSPARQLSQSKTEQDDGGSEKSTETDETGNTFGSKLGKDVPGKKHRSSGVQALAEFGSRFQSSAATSFKRMQRSLSSSSAGSNVALKSPAGVNPKVPQTQLPKDEQTIDTDHQHLHTLRKNFNNKFARVKIMDDHIISLHTDLSLELKQTEQFYEKEAMSWNHLYENIGVMLPRLQSSVSRITRNSTAISSKLEDVERQISDFRNAVKEVETQNRENDIRKRMAAET